jgi:hypothetical protein
MLGNPESERLKVTALILFRPTVSPPFEELFFSYYDTTFGKTGGQTKELFLSICLFEKRLPAVWYSFC